MSTVALTTQTLPTLRSTLMSQGAPAGRNAKGLQPAGGRPPASGAFVKCNVTEHEVAMHRRALAGGVPCPEIIGWEPGTGRLTMRRLPGSPVSDWYGEEAQKVPSPVFARVRELVAHLVDGCGMDFPDLTGYNVMIDFDNTDQMWLVDFEHARDVSGRAECCDFVQSFLKGKDSWNAEFA